MEVEHNVQQAGGTNQKNYAGVNELVPSSKHEGNNGSQYSQVRAWKYRSSHPLTSILTPIYSGIVTRSKFKNMIAFIANISMIEPMNIIKAVKDTDYIVTMQQQLNQFERNKIWNLVPK